MPFCQRKEMLNISFLFLAKKEGVLRMNPDSIKQGEQIYIYVGEYEVYVFKGLELDVEADYYSSEEKEVAMLELLSFIDEHELQPVNTKNDFIEVNEDDLIFIPIANSVSYAVDLPHLEKYDRDATIHSLEAMQSRGEFNGDMEEHLKFQDMNDEDLKWYFHNWINEDVKTEWAIESMDQYVDSFKMEKDLMSNNEISVIANRLTNFSIDTFNREEIKEIAFLYSDYVRDVVEDSLLTGNSPVTLSEFVDNDLEHIISDLINEKNNTDVHFNIKKRMESFGYTFETINTQKTLGTDLLER